MRSTQMARIIWLMVGVAHVAIYASGLVRECDDEVRFAVHQRSLLHRSGRSDGGGRLPRLL